MHYVHTGEATVTSKKCQFLSLATSAPLLLWYIQAVSMVKGLQHMSRNLGLAMMILMTFCAVSGLVWNTAR